MWDFSNIKPKQIKPIPWGWDNVKGDNGELWVVNHPMEIKMPNLVEYFDWDNFEVACPPGKSWLRLGTTNMKSTFTTAARFLSYEKLLLETTDLTPIADAFYDWNCKLLKAIRPVRWFVIGDDVGTTNGLMMSPIMWRYWIKPHLERLVILAQDNDCEVIYHSDGDIHEILDDLGNLGIIAIEGERVGHMTDLLDQGTYQGIKLMENTDPERQGAHKGWS